MEANELAKKLSARRGAFMDMTNFVGNLVELREY
jgi:hypothetical protein